MSYVFNMVGGGGGGSIKDTDAILTVTVPTGSTVTATKGGVTLTPTMWVQAADNTLDCALFVIAPSMFDSQNAWTVTATLGTSTASNTVMISSNEQYDLFLSYRIYIYRRGYINTALTGGLTNSGYTYASNSAKVATYNSDNIYISQAYACAGTSQAIDLTNYSTIYYVSRADSPSSPSNPWLGIASTKNLSNYLVQIKPGSVTEVTKSADISNLTGNYYIAAISTSSDGHGYVYEIYLE